MPIDQSRFIDLFIAEFHVPTTQINSEYERIVREHGDSDQIKIEFNNVVFTQLLSQFKNELPQNEQFKSIVAGLYDKYINELERQNIKADETKANKQLFLNLHYIPTKLNSQPILKVPEYKSYNLNTKYGRRKAREQAQRNYNALSSIEKERHNLYGIIILIVICLLMWLLLSTNGFLKWASH